MHPLVLILGTLLQQLLVPFPKLVYRIPLGIDLKEVIVNGSDVENYAIMTGYPGQMRACLLYTSTYTQ